MAYGPDDRTRWWDDINRLESEALVSGPVWLVISSSDLFKPRAQRLLTTQKRSFALNALRPSTWPRLSLTTMPR
jgi:hypothetical protein